MRSLVRTFLIGNLSAVLIAAVTPHTASAGDHQTPLGVFPYGPTNHSLGGLWEKHLATRSRGTWPTANLESAPCGALSPVYWLQIAPSEYAKPAAPYRENSWYNQTRLRPAPTMRSCASAQNSAGLGPNFWFTDSAVQQAFDVHASFGPYTGPYIHNDR
jgi:hypothetical protein